MALEITENRLEELKKYAGIIQMDGEKGEEEIVLRFAFPYPSAAEEVYNDLLDIEDDRCENCGVYRPGGLSGGLCETCNAVAQCQICGATLDIYGLHQSQKYVCEDCRARNPQRLSDLQTAALA